MPRRRTSSIASPATERVALQKSLDYPEGSAGRRMQTEVIAVPPFWTVGQAIDFMRDTKDLPETFYELYVVDPGHRLVGTVALDKLLRAKRPTKILSLADPERRTVEATDELPTSPTCSSAIISFPPPWSTRRAACRGDDHRRRGRHHRGGGRPGHPRAGRRGRRRGAVRHSSPIARSRFQWLFVNLLTAFLAAAVMKLFEASLEKMVALAVLAPIVASQGGNAATQTMTVAVRSLATGS